MKDKPREIILEQHLFAGDPNQFRCSKCDKPRCFHSTPVKGSYSTPIPAPNPFTPDEWRDTIKSLNTNKRSGHFIEAGGRMIYRP